MYGRVVGAASRPVSVSLQAVPHRSDLALTLQSGRLARLAPGGVLLSAVGGASILATAVRSPSSLMVDFRERAAARGAIPNTFPRRELAPAPSEILTSRLIDRALRPVLPASSPLALTVRLLASDRPSSVSLDALAVNAASVAAAAAMASSEGLSSSTVTTPDAAFRPVGAARIALIGGEIVAFPSLHDVARADVSLSVASRDNQVLSLLIDSVRKPVPEAHIVELLGEALRVADAMIAPQNDLLDQILALRAQEGRSDHPRVMPKPVALRKPEDAPGALLQVTDELKIAVENKSRTVYELAFVECRQFPGKSHRADVMTRAQQDIVDAFPELPMSEVLTISQSVAKKAYRDVLLRDSVRMDGRKFTEIRPVRCETSILQGAVHGSALFERGDTQVLACATIGLNKLALKIADHVDTANGLADSKPFYVHYSFPGYATGDADSFAGSGGGSRREVGHGALAESSLRPLVGSGDGLPAHFVTRLSAEVTASDGSSSMATVCAGSLALLDAGVQLRCPVAGVAMGLAVGDDFASKKDVDDCVVLSDILGAEDHFGVMDCKVSGTKDGVTAAQLDVKLATGLPLAVFERVLQGSKVARMEILAAMKSALPEDQDRLPDHAPRTERVAVDRQLTVKVLLRDRAAALKSIEQQSGARIFFEDDSADACLRIDAPSGRAAEEAKRLIYEAFGGIPVGTKLRARVVDTRQSYALLQSERGPLKGMLHVSKMNLGVRTPPSLASSDGDELEGASSKEAPPKTPDQMRYRDVRNVLRKGQVVDVVVIESDVTKDILRFSLLTPLHEFEDDAFLDSLCRPKTAARVAARPGLVS